MQHLYYTVNNANLVIYLYFNHSLLIIGSYCVVILIPTYLKFSKHNRIVALLALTVHGYFPINSTR